ncbi:22429_t:CDS:2 [Dentiscutata erythropus]|uniref:22429_t:CDS:1 n=1 Tax=Dentiscutata erythropus TaxID=1348616 RepID=A0A9N8ZTH4_9GLOM|nr:22429_t:CDS:2 [Dentiscutata erythropus]
MSSDESPAQKDTVPLLLRNVPRKYDAISEPTTTKHVTVENILKQKSLRDGQLECGKPSSLISTSNHAAIGNYPCSAALVVKNEGSTARDNFATERTFLSWLRMSTALILTGLSICLRFNLVPQPTTPMYVDPLDPNPMGILLIVAGILILIWAIVNYFRFQMMLEQRIAVVQYGKFNYFIISLVASLIFMTLFASIDYTNRAKENKGETVGASFVDSIFRWWFF